MDRWIYTHRCIYLHNPYYYYPTRRGRRRRLASFCSRCCDVVSWGGSVEYQVLYQVTTSCICTYIYMCVCVCACLCSRYLVYLPDYYTWCCIASYLLDGFDGPDVLGAVVYCVYWLYAIYYVLYYIHSTYTPQRTITQHSTAQHSTAQRSIIASAGVGSLQYTV